MYKEHQPMFYCVHILRREFIQMDLLNPWPTVTPYQPSQAWKTSNGSEHHTATPNFLVHPLVSTFFGFFCESFPLAFLEKALQRAERVFFGKDNILNLVLAVELFSSDKRVGGPYLKFTSCLQI